MATRPGVIFDVDGTLLDTNYLHAVAWTRALRAAGYEDVTMEQVHHAIGIASEGLVEHLVGHADEAAVEGHSAEYEPFQADIRAFPQAAELMRACRELGLAVVIATSGKSDDLDWMLPAIGVEEDVVDGASTSSDVENAKPAPELMQAAMAKSDLDPERTIAIGDTVWDVQAARRAGIPCIAVTCGGISEAELREAGAVEVWAGPAALLAGIESSRLASLVSGG